jgi:hypothetical protein
MSASSNETTVCARCRDRAKPPAGDAPRCAFPRGKFDADNWNCATMNDLRDKAEAARTAVWSQDNNGAMLAWFGRFVVLGWYKSRGRTEFAGVLRDGAIHPLSLGEAEDVLAGRDRDYDDADAEAANA